MAYDLGYSDPVEPRRKKRPLIGYGEEYGLGYDGLDEEVSQGSLPLAERNALLEQLGNATWTAVKGVGSALDYLGKNSREALTGKQDATGEDILNQLGMNPSADALGGFGRPLARFAAEVATDPLTYTGFGALGGGISKAGKAAKAANILDDAARSMSRSKVDDIIAGASSADDLGYIGKRTARHFDQEFGKPVTRLTDDDLYARPLVGSGEATRNQTLGQLLNRQKDFGQDHYDEAYQSLQDYFSKNPGLHWSADDAMKSALGSELANDFALGVPFTPFQVGVRLPFAGNALMKGADAAGDFLRWSAPGRYAHSAFNRDVHGATDAASQVQASALSRADRIATAAGRRESNRLLSLLPRFGDEAKDIRIGNAIRNVIEDIGPTLRGDDLLAHDEVLKHLNDFRAGRATGEGEQIGRFIDEWQKTSSRYLDRSRIAGIGSGELRDKFGTGYFPRVLDEAVFDKGTLGAGTKGKTFSVMTGDQLARGSEYHVPGGTQTIMELSQDPVVAGLQRTANTDEEAAQHILRVMQGKINALRNSGRSLLDDAGQPLTYSNQDAIALAKTLRQVSPDALKNKLPMFGQHPLENIAKYIQGRERAIGRTNVLYDALASSALPQHHTRVRGGGAESMGQALADLDLRTVDDRAGGGLIEGARVQMQARLQAIGNKHGIDELKTITADDMAAISVDTRLMKVLERMADFYEVPEVQSKVFKILDAVTTMWKSSILAWPSRFVRDWYSGIFSNFVMVENPFKLNRGYVGAKYLLQGQSDRLHHVLEGIPRYRAIKDPAARYAAYTQDLASTGISAGRQLEDVGQHVASARGSHGIRSSLFAGADPETTFKYQLENLRDSVLGLENRMVHPSYMPGAELFNLGNWAKSLGGTRKTITDAFLHGKKGTELVNPILRASAKAGDITDKINRLAGYNGLLLSGYSPQAAAKMVMEFHVDYSSLTKFEKGWIRNAIPFWSYQSRIGKWALKQIVQKPGGAFTQFGIRLPQDIMESNEGEYIPSRIANKYGISLENLRNLPGGKTLVDTLAPPSGNTSAWLSDIDLPGIDQINMIRPRTDAEGNLNYTGSAMSSLLSLAEGAHPLVKLGAEVTTGRDAYTGIKKNWGRSTLPTLVARSGGLDPNNYQDLNTLTGLGYADAGLQFLVPFYSRIAQLARKGTDPRVEDPNARALQTLATMFTGTKIENIDDAERTRDAMSKIAELLDSDPAVRNFESVYIPKDILPTVDPAVAELYQLQRQLGRERRQKAKVRPDVYNPLNY